MKKYFSGVIRESKRVEWPKGKKLREMTLSVLAVSAAFGAAFFIMDFIINLIFGALGV